MTGLRFVTLGTVTDVAKDGKVRIKTEMGNLFEIQKMAGENSSFSTLVVGASLLLTIKANALNVENGVEIEDDGWTAGARYIVRRIAADGSIIPPPTGPPAADSPPGDSPAPPAK